MKDKSLSVLIKEADAVFSKYIRRRDANPQNPFYLNCFTCGEPERIEFAQAAHFVDRAHMATRYDEMNVHACCEHCNCFDPDHFDTYAHKMRDKYGLMETAKIMLRSKGLQKFMRHELEEIIETYKLKLKQYEK